MVWGQIFDIPKDGFQVYRKVFIPCAFYCEEENDKNQQLLFK